MVTHRFFHRNHICRKSYRAFIRTGNNKITAVFLNGKTFPLILYFLKRQSLPFPQANLSPIVFRSVPTIIFASLQSLSAGHSCFRSWYMYSCLRSVTVNLSFSVFHAMLYRFTFKTRKFFKMRRSVCTVYVVLRYKHLLSFRQCCTPQ